MFSIAAFVDRQCCDVKPLVGLVTAFLDVAGVITAIVVLALAHNGIMSCTPTISYALVGVSVGIPAIDIGVLMGASKRKKEYQQL